MDHKGEFTLQVLKKLGPESSEKIDWSGPRLLCIAGDFTRYDEYAVLQIPRNIELLRYRRYGGDLLLLELIRGSTAIPSQRRSNSRDLNKERPLTAETVVEPDAIQDVWESLKAFLLALGDDVQMKELEGFTRDVRKTRPHWNWRSRDPHWERGRSGTRAAAITA
jgi:hypothetical protein